MTDIRELLEKYGAVRHGHFLLSSGLHSHQYFQCALVLQHPEATAELARRMVADLKPGPVDVVIGPAIGGIVLAYELARQLNARALFAEREEGRMKLRRGFELAPGERVLVTEDVVTTGGSAREVVELVREMGATPIGVVAIVDRSGGRVSFEVPFHALLVTKVSSYRPEYCPLCQEELPLVKPGSRETKPVQALQS